MFLGVKCPPKLSVNCTAKRYVNCNTFWSLACALIMLMPLCNCCDFHVNKKNYFMRCNPYFMTLKPLI